jgi:ribosomal protein S7
MRYTDYNYEYFYRSFFFKKFINKLAIGGRYSVIEKIIYDLLKDIVLNNIFNKNYRGHLVYKGNLLPIFIFFEIIFLCKPLLHVKIWTKKRRGKKKLGKKNQVQTTVIPVTITRRKGYCIVLQWLVLSIKNHNEKTIKLSILREFKDILCNKDNESDTMDKKEELHNLITVNRNRMHFRWL